MTVERACEVERPGQAAGSTIARNETLYDRFAYAGHRPARRRVQLEQVGASWVGSPNGDFAISLLSETSCDSTASRFGDLGRGEGEIRSRMRTGRSADACRIPSPREMPPSLLDSTSISKPLLNQFANSRLDRVTSPIIQTSCDTMPGWTCHPTRFNSSQLNQAEVERVAIGLSIEACFPASQGSGHGRIPKMHQFGSLPSFDADSSLGVSSWRQVFRPALGRFAPKTRSGRRSADRSPSRVPRSTIYCWPG